MKIIGFGKANEEDITEYEQKMGCRFPEDYKQFLLEYNGGIPETENNHINIGLSRNVGVFRINWLTYGGEARNRLYSVCDDVKNLGAIMQPEYFIPFASADLDLSIIISIKEDMKGIYIYDFLRVLKESKKTPFHKVCDTFTEFLELIVPNEQ